MRVNTSRSKSLPTSLLELTSILEFGVSDTTAVLGVWGNNLSIMGNR